MYQTFKGRRSPVLIDVAFIHLKDEPSDLIQVSEAIQYILAAKKVEYFQASQVGSYYTHYTR